MDGDKEGGVMVGFWVRRVRVWGVESVRLGGGGRGLWAVGGGGGGG